MDIGDYTVSVCCRVKTCTVRLSHNNWVAIGASWHRPRWRMWSAKKIEATRTDSGAHYNLTVRKVTEEEIALIPSSFQIQGPHDWEARHCSMSSLGPASNL